MFLIWVEENYSGLEQKPRGKSQTRSLENRSRSQQDPRSYDLSEPRKLLGLTGPVESISKLNAALSPCYPLDLECLPTSQNH